MRYQTAVVQLLKRLERQPDAVAAQVSPTLLGSLGATTLRQCSRFSVAWQLEVSDKKSDRKSQMIEARDLRHPLLDAMRWGKMAEHLPAIVLALELSQRDSTQLLHPRVVTKLLKSVMYGIPCRECSLQVYGVLRALLLHVLPRDLSKATTTQLFVTFSSLSLIKWTKEEDSREFAESHSSPSSVLDSVRQRNREVAAAIAALPHRFARHFVVEDDTALLQQLCEELARRLPPKGETLAQDYLQTLIEGPQTDDGTHMSLNDAYTFRWTEVNSSTTAVSREELTSILPKLVAAERRAMKWDMMEGFVAARDMGDGRQRKERRRHYCSPEAAAAIGNAVAGLCLVSQTKDVLAARDLVFMEWLFLVTTATSSEESWARAALPATSVALQAAEAKRLERKAKGMATGQLDAVDTIFPGLTPFNARWLLRLYVANIFALREDLPEVLHIMGATKILIAEYFRQMRSNWQTAPHTLFHEFSAQQGFWTFMRALGIRGTVKPWVALAAHEDDVDARGGSDDWSGGDGDGAAAVAHGGGAPGLSSDEMIDLLRNVIDITQAAVDPMVGDVTPAAAAPPPVPPAPVGDGVEEKKKKKRGAGFGRTAGRPPIVSTAAGEHAEGDVSPASRKDIGMLQLLVDAKQSLCILLLRRAPLNLREHRAAVATTLETLSQTNHLFIDFARFGRRTDLPAGGYKVRKLKVMGAASELDYLLDKSAQLGLDALYLAWTLLRESGERALLPEEYAAVVARLAQIAVDTAKLVELMGELSAPHRQVTFLVQRIYSCYQNTVVPGMAAAEVRANDAHDRLSHELRRAMQQLSCACLETLHKMWSSTHLSSASQQRLAYAAGRSTSFPSPQLNAVRLVDTAILMGVAAGLTTEEMPHLVSTAKRMMEVLAECAEGPAPSAAAANAKSSGVERPSLLPCFARSFKNICLLGVADEGFLQASVKALRACGVDDIIRAQSHHRRSWILTNTVGAIRILVHRLSTSRASRLVVKQQLTMAARLASERLTYTGPVHIKERRKGAADATTNTALAILMWEVWSAVLPYTASLGTVDPVLRTLQVYVQRHLVPPTCPGFTWPSSLPTADHLERYEAIERSPHLSKANPFNIEHPQTAYEVVKVANYMAYSVTESIRVAYRRILADLANSPSPAQRSQWHAHAETYIMLIGRLQSLLAPSLWTRVIRVCLQIHIIFAFPNMFTPAMQAMLILSMERVLLYSKTHDNKGQWHYRGTFERVEENSHHLHPLDVMANEQLIPYNVAARYFGFQDFITDITLRVYLVELLDRHVESLKDVVADGDAPPHLRQRAFTSEAERALIARSMLYSGRQSICSAFRRMQL